MSGGRGGNSSSSSSGGDGGAGINFIPFEQLRLSKVIGKGNFGSVYDGDYLGTRVAIKELYNQSSSSGTNSKNNSKNYNNNNEYGIDFGKYYDREIYTLSTSRHPNIVQFMGVSKDEQGQVYIVTEFCDGPGNLHTVLKNLDLPWAVRVDMLIQIAQAIAYLHSRGIIHRDLKCENILLTKEGVCKVCDFGFARKQETTKGKRVYMTVCGTDWTMAPEILLALDYNESVDVFSYGMIMAETISRKAPSHGNWIRALPGLGVEVGEVDRLAEKSCPPELKKMTEKCLDDLAANRPTFQNVITELKAIRATLDSPPTPTTLEGMISKISLVDTSSSTAASAGKPAVKVAPKNSEKKDEVNGIIVKRVTTSIPARIQYEYYLENPTDKDTRVYISFEGDNFELEPSPYASLIRNATCFDVVVNAKGEEFVGTILQHDPSKRVFSYTTTVQTLPVSSQVVTDEINGIILYTTITPGEVSDVLFEVQNKQDFDVSVTIDVDGDLVFGPGSVEPPLVGNVTKGKKETVGKLRTSAALSRNWKWRQLADVPNVTEEISVNRGVQLIRRQFVHKLGYLFLEVKNTRDQAVEVKLEVSGDVEGLATNPMVLQINAHGSVKIPEFRARNDVMVDWGFKEL